MARWNNVELAVGLARTWLRGSSYATGSATGLAQAGLTTSTSMTAARSTAWGAGRNLLSEASGLHRKFSSHAKFFDMMTLPSRKGIFSDAALVSGLLPNRKDFTPQFSPHGLTLVPKAIMMPDKAGPAQAGSPAGGASSARLEAAKAQLSGVRAVGGVGVAADRAAKSDSMLAAGRDKTMVWRRLKIKKHKIKKRRKLNRYKND